MAVLKINTFSGVIPVSGDRALPDTFGTESVNTWLYGSELRGMRPPAQIETINTTTRKLFRIPKRTVGGDPMFPTMVPPPSYLGDSVWVQFLDPNTDILKGQLLQDQYERYYFCSPSTGPMFNTYTRLQAGLPAYRLGVPGPNNVISGGTNAAQPTITSITGGATPTVTRAYVYTWVNQFGEESSPSLPVLGAGNANATWNIGNITDPAAPAGNQPSWSKKYLYRTITGASGQTTYYRVGEVAIGTTTYADNASVMTDAVLANNLILESTTWAPPPVDLEGMVAMPNGFLIGFKGNQLYMSEPYHWHAWPEEYKQAVEAPIVGLGVFGQTCVVCTQAHPTTVTGATPANCSFTKSDTNEPCLSRGSIVSTTDGVIYASQNGLILVSSAGFNNITSQVITREQWITRYTPQFLRAARYQNGYLALRELPAPQDEARSAFFIDPTELKVALTEFSDFESVDGLMSDFWSGEVFLLHNGAVKRWDAPSDDIMPVKWKSKEFQYLFKENFGCYAVYWDDDRYSDVSYGVGVLPTDEKVRLRVMADRQVVYDEEVPVNGGPVRLPSGFKADIWQFELIARAPVYSLHIASTMKELKGA